MSQPRNSRRGLGKLWTRQWKVEGKSREKLINATTICQKLNGKRSAAERFRKSYEHRLLITEEIYYAAYFPVAEVQRIPHNA